MSRWRIAVCVLLVATPLLFLTVCGSYFLWQYQLGFVLWWPMMACMAIGYLLARYWLRRKLLLHPIDFTPPAVATERDRKAWQLIEDQARHVRLTTDQLTDADTYWKTARKLAEDLAIHYHPGSDDPLGGLTIPEMLAVIQLASRDLGEWFDRYVPGGHVVTITDLRRVRKLAEWYKVGSNLIWLASAFFDPAGTAARYAASQAGVTQPMEQVQQNLLAWAYTAFVQRVGFYLVELYSGRLRVGTQRWQELVREQGPVEPRVVTLTILGQVKAGKSSLVNALLGERKAETDVLPATDTIERFHLSPRGVDAELLLLDTPGYGHEGPKKDQVEATRAAARQSDVLLLVMHGRNPARQADVAMLRSLKEWFAENPDLKMPPVVGLLTHIDLLSPAMEWSPPYDWQAGERPKEKSMRAAVEAALEQLGDLVDVVLPVCTAEGKVYGIEEGVLPALAARLGEARVVTVLRCLRAEPDRGKVKRVFGQLYEAGKGLLRMALQKT